MVVWAPGQYCESCGACEDLVQVRRIYLTPVDAAEADQIGSPFLECAEVRARVAEEPEWWCYSCRAHYPHESV